MTIAARSPGLEARTEALDTRGEARARIWLAVILAGCLVTLAAAPLPHPDGDAVLYGTIAKNVLASGEWLTLQHQSGWLVDKPPLTIWLIALSFRLGGVNDTMLRLWQLLMSLALVVVTYRIARLSAGKEESLLAALLLVTTLQIFLMSIDPQQDVPLALFLALAFYAYLQYCRKGRTGSAALVGLWVALAVLTKGIVGLVAFAAIVGGDLLVARLRGDRDGHWRWAQIAIGAAVCLAVAAPWFVVGVMRQGKPFADTFFLKGTLGVGRFFSPVLRSPGPYWQALIAYVPILLLWILPWTGLLPGTVRAAWLSLREGAPSLRLCAVWAGLYFLGLSVSPGDKVFRYLHPLYPPLAVLAARFLVDALDTPRRLRPAAVISLVVGIPALIALALLLAGLAPEGFRLYLPIAIPFMLVFSLVLAAFSAAALRERARLAVVLLAAGVVVAYGLFEWQLRQHWEQIWPWRQVAATVHGLYRPGDRVVFVGGPGAESNFASFYLNVPIAIADDAAVVQAWEAGRVFGLLSPAAFARLRDRLRPTVLVQMPMGWVLVTNR